MEEDKQQQTTSEEGEQQQQQRQQPDLQTGNQETGQQQQQDEDIQTTGLVESYSDYGIKYIQGNLDMGDLTNNFDLTNFDLSDVDVAAFENVANEVSISTSSLPLVSGNVSVPTTIVTTSEGEHAQIILQPSSSSETTAITVQEITRIDESSSRKSSNEQEQQQQEHQLPQQQTTLPHKIIVHPSGSQPGKSDASIKQARVITNFNKDKFKVHKSPMGQIIVGEGGHVTYGGSRLKPGQAVLSYTKSISTPQGSRATSSIAKGTPTLLPGSSGSGHQVFVLPPGTTFCKAGTSTSTPIVGGAQRTIGKTQANGSSAPPKQQLVFTTSLPGSSPSKSGTTSGQLFMLPASFLQTKAGTTFLNSGNKQIVQITQAGTPVIAPKTTSYIPIAPATALSGTAQGAKLILTTGSPSETGMSAVLGNLQLSTSMTSSSPSVTLKTVTNGSLKTQAANVSGYSSEIQKRKPCNCTKSQCLKLYCDCFANGEFCSGCNCNNCFNNLSHEEDRQKAIRQCLERNPQAFHPKIGKAIRMQAGETADAIERRHTKGCNCKRSGCLKNYCECYEAKILCSNLCKCCGCKNYEESFERKTLMHLAADSTDPPRSSSHISGSIRSNWFSNDFKPKLPIQPNQSTGTLPCSFINNDVIQATCQCLLAQAERAEANETSAQELEHTLLEEYGKCLTAIIDSASNSKRRVRT